MYRKAVKVCPSYAPAHYNLGVAAGEAGDLEAAKAHYQQAVLLEPRYAEAHCNLGVIHKAQVGRLRVPCWQGRGGLLQQVYYGHVLR